MILFSLKINPWFAKMYRLCATMAVFFICHSQSAGAACNSEIKNAYKVSERIANEWPLRSSQDHKTQHVRKIVEYLIPAIKLHMGSRNLNWPLVGRWEFLLVRDLSVNAYSIGNGKVYLTDGTYDFVETEAELAAIIAHEMAHQLMGHFCQNDKGHATHGVGSLMQVIDNTKEIEADSLAVEILKHTDFPAQAMLTVVQRLPVIKGEKTQKELRVKALERQLKEIELIPFFSSLEFLRIKEDSNSGLMFE
jgi:beta-barrel assembly-enhancing protease